MKPILRLLCLFVALAIVAALPCQARIVRIAFYNIEADIGVTNKQATFTNIVTTNNEGPPLPGLIAPATNGADVQLGGAVEGIGEEMVNGNAQPVDILAFEETTGNQVTIAPIVSGMNTFYGVAGMYASSPYQATENDGFTGEGNGPNAVIYNTLTMQLLSSTPVDPVGGTNQLGGYSSGLSGEYREVMRYQFAPAGVAANASNTFYVYVSHYKSGSSSTANNWESREGEATIVRTNMESLPSGVRIVYGGDFNTGETSEQMYGVLVASGNNQLIDPLNPTGSLTTNFDNNSSAPIVLTDSDTSLEYRDDYEMMTTNVYYDAPGGLTLIPGTYHAFANNGSVAYEKSVNIAGNTALANLVTNGTVFISAAQIDVDLTGGSDHLPIVADYTIPIPEPVITSASITGNNLALSVTNGITNGVYVLLMNSNLSAPLTTWTSVATNTAPAANFSFIATNSFNPSVANEYFVLQTH